MLRQCNSSADRCVDALQEARSWLEAAVLLHAAAHSQVLHILITAEVLAADVVQCAASLLHDVQVADFNKTTSDVLLQAS